MKYARTDKGWRYVRVTLHKSGKIKGAIVGGKEEPLAKYSGGEFYIRTYEGSKPVYTAIGNEGNDRTEAVRMWRQQSLAMANPDVEIDPIVGNEKLETLAQWSKKFLEEKSLEPHRSRDTMDNYCIIVEEFTQVAGPSKAPSSLTAFDVKRYHKHLRDRGLSERTVANRFTSLLTFLRYARVDVNEMLPKSTRRKLTRYTEKKVEIYTPEAINKLIDASNEYHALVWYFLYKTGFRMQEAMYLEWDDVDFRHNTVSVRSKPALGFEPKDSEERSVPLINGLGDKLKAWRKRHPQTRFVFGTSGDLPNNHWLEYLKEAAERAGLDSKKCYLHKFRATYCTRDLRSGLDLRTVQRLMGHSDLQSTMRYLRPAENEEVHGKLNAAFAE